jgi:hypothetical protein
MMMLDYVEEFSMVIQTRLIDVSCDNKINTMLNGPRL